jgi:AraC-like DNA-binding protein
MASDAAVDARKRPLRRFPVLRAAGLEAGQASIAHLLTPFAVALPEGNARAEVRSDVSAVSLGPVSLVYAHSTGAELSVQLTQQVSYYDINFALEGVNRIQDRDNLVVLSPRRAAVISPRMAPAMRLSDGYGQLHVRIERPALERHLERMLRRPVTSPVLFSMEMDLTAPAVASWAGVIRLLLRDLDEPSGLTGSGAVPGPWTDFLMTGLLLAQPHSYSHWLAQDRADAGGRPPSLQRVIDVIEREPGADLSLTRLATAGGMGPRALQRNFREYVGVSPREYVRWVRLGRARDDLVAGAGGTVAEIAFRWGFTHAPRFAGAYQDRYGEAPSATLQAARTRSRTGSPRRLTDRQGRPARLAWSVTRARETGRLFLGPARNRVSGGWSPWPRSATRPERSSSSTPTAPGCTLAMPARTCTTRAGSSAR